MKVKYLADENLKRGIVLGVRRREPAVDFRFAPELGLAGKDDLTVLQTAARERRVLVSHDIRTLPKHFSELISQQSSYGVFLVPQRLASSAVIEELITIWLASEAEEWENRICYLPL